MVNAMYEWSRESPTKVQSFLSPLREEVSCHGSKRINDGGSLTFSIYPQQGAVLFPFLEYLTSGEPGARLSVVSVTCRLVVCRWVWRTKPC